MTKTLILKSFNKNFVKRKKVTIFAVRFNSRKIKTLKRHSKLKCPEGFAKEKRY